MPFALRVAIQAEPSRSEVSTQLTHQFHCGKQTLFEKRTAVETEPLQTSSLSVNFLSFYVCLYSLDRGRKTWRSYFYSLIMHYCLRLGFNVSSKRRKAEVLFCIAGLLKFVC